MSEPTNAGTALATSDAAAKLPKYAGLPPEYAAALKFRREQAEVAQHLAGMNWGLALDERTRRAIGMWGHENSVDVTREIDVLGGRIYLNSTYYYRVLAEMTGAAMLEYAFSDHVHADARLEKLAEAGDAWGIEEKTRRDRLRIQYNIPEKAVGAVVFRVKPKTLTTEVVGVKWTGGGTQSKDPVGDARPVETAESRAMRRAMLKLCESTKSPITDRVAATIGSTEQLNDVIGAAIKANDAEPGPRRIVPGCKTDDPLTLLPPSADNLSTEERQAMLQLLEAEQEAYREDGVRRRGRDLMASLPPLETDDEMDRRAAEESGDLAPIDDD